MSKRRGHDFGEVRTNTGSDKSPSIKDQVDQFKFPPDKFVTVRIITPVYMYAGYWVATKKKDGSPTRFYMPSPSYNPESQTFDSTVFDPFFEISKGEKGVERDSRMIQIQKYGYCCAIVMHEEARRPERIPRPTENELATGFKEKDSDSWTPVKVLRLSSTMMEQIAGIAQTNIVTNRSTGEQKAMSIAHPQFGMTIRIKHSPKKPAASQYQILPGEKMPLNDRQKKYLTWDLSDLERAEPEDQIRESYDRWAEKMGLADAGGGDDGFDDDQNPGRGQRQRPVKKAVKKGARPQQQAQDDWDDGSGGDAGGDEGWDDGSGGDGWDEPAPQQQRRPVKKAVKKAARQAPPADEWDDGSGGDAGGDEGWDDNGDGTEGWDESGGGDGTEESWDDGSGEAGGDEGWDDGSGGDTGGDEGWDDGSGAEGGDEGWDDGSGGGDDGAPWEDDGSSGGGDEGWDEPAPQQQRRPVKKAARPQPQQQQRPVKKAARPPQQQQRPVKKAVKKAPQRRPSDEDWG